MNDTTRLIRIESKLTRLMLYVGIDEFGVPIPRPELSEFVPVALPLSEGLPGWPIIPEETK